MAVLVCALVTSCGEAPDPPQIGFSLFAIGDSGAPPSDAVDYPRMLAVARALADEDERRPANALLLLGDNFYPVGLKSDELAARVRANLVRPFCRFVADDGPRYPEVAADCERARRPLPIFAILGNHDYMSAGSPELQRSDVSDFVSNWQMPAGLAGIHEFGDTSLILFDAEAVAGGAELAPLVEALKTSRGPWRILAGHRPIATSRPTDPPETTAYVESVRRAIRAAGVDVQLFVSGHEHRLSILEMPAPDPALHLISGAGSNTRKDRDPSPRIRAEFESLGFARIERIGTGAAARLVVSLYRVPRYAWLRSLRNRSRVARFAVDVGGRVSEGAD